MNIPVGFQTRYFRELEGDVPPTIEKRGTTLFIPCFIRQEEREGVPLYKWFTAEVPFRGQDFSDYDRCILQAACEIRAFFYATPAAQGEMRDDATWEAHRQAVRSSFPKYPGEINTAMVRWNEIKTTFWATIDTVLESVGKDRSVLPDYFNDSYMVEWAIQNKVPADVMKAAEEVLVRVSLNLNANGRNWKELFA